MPQLLRSLALIIGLATLSLTLTACGDKPAGSAAETEVVVYTALDREFSEPILKKFEAETGIKVLPKYDTESTKTVGLTNALRAEKNRPRCDVFWNNEIVNTIRLKQEGLLTSYHSEAGKGFPATFRDPDGMWIGFAGRGRVLLVNTDLVPADATPTSIRDLTKPEWKGKVGIAKPLFGTTATYVASLFALLGEADATALLDALKANEIRIEAGNKQVALAVSGGALAMGLTDTDDAMGEVEAGKPVKIVYLDADTDGMGTLFIPNTLALMKDCPHPEAGRRLIDYLLSPEVEIALSKAAGAQIPLNPAVTEPARVKTPKDVKAMEVDFNAAAAEFDKAAAYIEKTFLAN